MALIQSISEECVKSELDLFTPPLTQTSIKKRMYDEIPPLSAITGSGAVEFFVSASVDYMDLNNTYLHLVKYFKKLHYPHTATRGARPY